MNIQPDLISVIVLSFGPSELYCDTLQSVLSQTYPQIELIISDDASKTFDERSVYDIIEKNAKENIKHIIVHQNEKNVGTTRHCNIAASFANGRYIKLIADGDSFLDAVSLQRLWEFACIYPESEIVSSPCQIISEKHKKCSYQFPSRKRIELLEKTEDMFNLLAYQNIYSAVGMLYKQEFFRRGGFNQEYRYLEDWPTWLDMARNGHVIPCSRIPTMKYTLKGVSNASGSAFESDILHEDMLMCYEKEILPYAGLLTPNTKRYVQYQYGRLRGEHMKWTDFPLEWKRILKKAIKRIFFS